MEVSNNVRELKFLFGGEYNSHKYSLIQSLAFDKYDDEFVIFHSLDKNLTVDNKEYKLKLWDIKGQEDYSRIRMLKYPETNCFFLCYPVFSRSSFDNIWKIWYPEVRHFLPDIPIFLIATKSDQRTEKNGEINFITTEEGLNLKEKIGAIEFYEFPSDNLNEILITAIRAVENNELIQLNKKIEKKCCTLC